MPQTFNAGLFAKSRKSVVEVRIESHACKRSTRVIFAKQKKILRSRSHMQTCSGQFQKDNRSVEVRIESHAGKRSTGGLFAKSRKILFSRIKSSCKRSTGFFSKQTSFVSHTPAQLKGSFSKKKILASLIPNDRELFKPQATGIRQNSVNDYLNDACFFNFFIYCRSSNNLIERFR